MNHLSSPPNPTVDTDLRALLGDVDAFKKGRQPHETLAPDVSHPEYAALLFDRWYYQAHGTRNPLPAEKDAAADPQVAGRIRNVAAGLTTILRRWSFIGTGGLVVDISRINAY